MVVHTMMGFEWEGCFVESGGKTCILDLPRGHEGAERLKGKRVKVAGILEHRTVGFPDHQYEMPFISNATLVSAEAVEIKGKLDVDNSALGLFACRPGWPAYKPRSVCPLSWSFSLTVHSSSVSRRNARLNNSTRFLAFFRERFWKPTARTRTLKFVGREIDDMMGAS
jgi:hypothetical protein